MDIETTETPVIVKKLLKASKGKRYVEFTYTPQTDKKVAEDVKTDINYANPISIVKGFLTQDAVWKAKSGHWCVKVYNMARKVKTVDGHHSNVNDCRTGEGFKQGVYLPRTYRIAGINESSAKSVAGSRGKVSIFEI
jgi:hypothetical protein